MRAVGRRFATLVVLAAAFLSIWSGSASAADEFDQFRLESASVSLSTTQAGAHPDFTTNFSMSQKEGQPYARVRDVEVTLPPGLIGNPQALPHCSVAQLAATQEESECPFSSQVGVTSIRVIEPVTGTFLEPIYNMETPENSDVVARLGFYAGAWPAFINVRVNPIDYSLKASIERAPAASGLLEANTTLWGVPADPSHDLERLTPQEAGEGKSPPPPGRSAGLPEAPFMTNPTDCSLRRQMTITARSYQLPDNPSSRTLAFPDITGCGKLNFEPRFSVVPTNPEASAPTGIEAELEVPQDENPGSLATSTLKGAVVTLPEGLTINPAAGGGLEACSAEQVGFEQIGVSRCPEAAKIGSADIEVPALAHVLHGAVYQRTPEPGNLFRFWLVADELGVNLKLPAEIHTNPLTGQVTTVFNGPPSLGGNPQVPVSDLKLHIFGGPRAPLSTPASCGTYQTHFAFAPWSGKAPVEGNTSMHITSGCGKGGFKPGLIAGPLDYTGGDFSPFTFTLTRQDGEANPQKIALHLPQGLLAKPRGVPICPDAAAATGACPAASKVGTVTASAGVGGAPLWIPQPGKAPTSVYWAGPYKGGPYSVVSVVPAQAGPFDLGTVVNRAAVEIDPETALATIQTDPLPQILEGVPVSYRTIHVDVDRRNFTLNPTSCARKKIKATVTASDGATAEPETGFRAVGCGRLKYTPKLKLLFRGQTNRTGNPSIKGVLTQRPNQANTKAATVLLPAGEFIDNAHINNPCTRVQFNAEKCPKNSILGHVEASSPLLDRPLKGPVYFRSNGGDRQLPDIVADLRGQIHIILVGYIDSVKTGPETSRVRTRFLHVPDAPVTKFTISFFGGKKGLIENSVDICRHPRHAQLKFTAQNGKQRNTNAVISTNCVKRR